MVWSCSLPTQKPVVDTYRKYRNTPDILNEETQSVLVILTPLGHEDYPLDTSPRGKRDHLFLNHTQDITQDQGR